MNQGDHLRHLREQSRSDSRDGEGERCEGVPGKHLLDQERPLAIRAETNQERQIDLWATYLSEIMERVSPLMAVVRSGAEIEPEMDKLYRELHKDRRSNLHVIAQSILDHRTPRNRLSVEKTTDILWQLASPEMFHLLSTVGGYSTRQFDSWLGTMLRASLLGQHAQ